jgi:hypothetical protein
MTRLLRLFCLKIRFVETTIESSIDILHIFQLCDFETFCSISVLSRNKLIALAS